ncbi:MAG TPA: hypothetical protein VHC19_07805, partial [Pirellulales bacterium]|nr:hypothetical protein [Pirellulales bacterium]
MRNAERGTRKKKGRPSQPPEVPSAGWATPESLGGVLDKISHGKRHKQLLALLLFTTLALAAGSAAQKSVTVDEFQGLPLGLATLKTADFHLGVTNPLLSSALAALPLLATSAELNPEPLAGYVSSWQCGGQFLRENAAAAGGARENRGRYHD